jgi:Arc/MetJ-type ribon-helix-helix transcriptional regulator
MPATTSPKSITVPVRITPAMRRQLDELIALGFGTQADVIRLAVDRMHQAETQAAKSAE